MSAQMQGMEAKTYKIAVAGAGYVGLSQAVLLARQHHVCVVDVVPGKIEKLNRGESPIDDKELKEYLVSGSLNLTATGEPETGYRDADYVVIAVPTNYDCEKNYFDTTMIETVQRQVRQVNQHATIVIKSTIPVGYTKSLRERTSDRNIIFSPEFLRESRALYDNLYPSRIIVGTDLTDEELTKSAKRFAGLLQRAALKENVKTLVMGTTEAEAVKLFANTYLALRVSYFNELDTYAEVNGLDTRSIIRGVCLDPRVGTDYNNPSFGYGGYCLPKDTKQLLANYGPIPQRMMRAVVESNQVRKEYIAGRILELVKGEDKPVVGVYRLAMKAGSDNFRESSIISVMELLCEQGVELLVYEPTLKAGAYRTEDDFLRFCDACSIIIANRCDEMLKPVREKVYTRDLFGQN